MVKLRLTRKFAQRINGIDLSSVQAGDDIEVSEHEAEILMREGWASPVDTADDRDRRPKVPRVVD
jgi:hypothetical protein